MDTTEVITPDDLALAAEALAAEAYASSHRATARKRGRNPRWPHVPLLIHTDPDGRTWEEQVRGKAFADRAEAVAFAVRVIEQRRADLARRLQEPRERALREAYGLPREVAR